MTKQSCLSVYDENVSCLNVHRVRVLCYLLFTSWDLKVTLFQK